MTYNNEPNESDDLTEKETAIPMEQPSTNDVIEPDKPKSDETHTLKKRTCPYCKQEYQTKVGMSNWKNLFRKPTIDDWVTLIILFLLFLAAFAYTTETRQCREMVSNIGQVCMNYNKLLTNETRYDQVMPLLNYTVENETSQDNLSNLSGQTIGGENDENRSVNETGYFNDTYVPYEGNINVTTVANQTNAS